MDDDTFCTVDQQITNFINRYEIVVYYTRANYYFLLQNKQKLMIIKTRGSV